MQEQYESNELRASDDATLSGGTPAGQEPASIKAWSEPELAPGQSGSVAAQAGIALALSEDSFVFKLSTPEQAADVGPHDGGLLMTYDVGAVGSLFATLFDHAASSVMTEVPDSASAWSLRHDDFGNF